MKSPKINPKLRGYADLVEGLGKMMGSNCEVLLHDLAHPENSVIACANTGVTGRGPGSPMTDFGLLLMKDKSCKDKSGLFIYPGKTDDGRDLRCGVFFIKDEDGQVIGHLCVNIDISKAAAAREFLEEYTSVDADAGKQPQNCREHFSRELGGVVESSLEYVRAKWGRRLPELTREEKVAAVRELEERGFFLVKGAVELLAREMGKSKFTLYAYLRESRR